MNVVESNAEVMMAREHFDEVPRYSVPDGYGLRWFRGGDQLLWRDVQSAADKYNDITADLFAQEFGSDPGVHAQRICFLEQQSDRQVVGTASAWWQENPDGTAWGRVHWVAVLPTHQGLGLSKVLLSTVCRRLRELGHMRAFLTTSAARIPAINLYRLFGFQPVVYTAQDWRVWKSLEPHVKLGLGDDFPKEGPTKECR